MKLERHFSNYRVIFHFFLCKLFTLICEIILLFRENLRYILRHSIEKLCCVVNFSSYKGKYLHKLAKKLRYLAKIRFFREQLSVIVQNLLFL